jgi:hypothetical protein
MIVETLIREIAVLCAVRDSLRESLRPGIVHRSTSEDRELVVMLNNKRHTIYALDGDDKEVRLFVKEL